ncbi:hypothetical protein [Saccharothrix australiensis]|uniref:hypothetical protein n=1 Tax=Saccharothrix australiensis TaxID=2072 RepID=UPI0011C3863A|nr:hypothetical protein [Saccharothrix australiensis]
MDAWQEARRRQRLRRAGPPSFGGFVDLPARAAAGITRIILGAIAGAVFHDQLAGIAAAIAVGASAPAVLQQFASFQSARQAIEHDGGPAPAGQRTDGPARHGSTRDGNSHDEHVPDEIALNGAAHHDRTAHDDGSTTNDTGPDEAAPVGTAPVGPAPVRTATTRRGARRALADGPEAAR